MNRISTGIIGFDKVTYGGLIRGKQYLVIGPPGSGKTVFGVKFGLEGVKRNENVVYITVDEKPDTLTQNMKAFGLDISSFNFIDATPTPDSSIWLVPQRERMKGIFAFLDIELNLDSLKDIIRSIHNKKPISRLIVDSITTLLSFYKTEHEIRRATIDFMNFLRSLKCTTIFTAEEHDINRVKILEHISDGVIRLKRKNSNRLIAIEKLRGQEYLSGDHTLKILSGPGIEVYPKYTAYEYYDLGMRKEFSEPAKFGIAQLDNILGGGLPRNTITLLSGNSGTGKTILSLIFLLNGVKNGESGVYVTLESDIQKVTALMLSLGIDLMELTSKGFALLSIDPNFLDINELTLLILETLKETNASRFVLDGFRVLELFYEPAEINNFIHSLAKIIHSNLLTSIITREIPEVVGTLRFTEAGISYNFDNIVLLRFLEKKQKILKTIAVVKMVKHCFDPTIYEYVIVPNKIIEIMGPVV